MEDFSHANLCLRPKVCRYRKGMVIKVIYLSHFTFPDAEREYDFILGQKRTCYDTVYPFQILSKHRLSVLDFEPVTILYGGNGCGKTTALNVIAEKLGLKRDTLYNRSNFFETYTHMCDFRTEHPIPSVSRIITSDDVFDFMLNLRSINEGSDGRLRESHMARSKSQSKYVRKNLMDNVREHSNGESAFLYFSEKIEENGLYLLDEPENSLSPDRQQELLKFLEDSARFFGCQFLISTHSPFLLSMRNAKIYDMDEEVVDVKRWTELENVRVYYEFFKKHEGEF